MHLYLLVVNTCITRAHDSWKSCSFWWDLHRPFRLAEKVASSAQHNLHHLAMPRYTRVYGKSSSWDDKGWAPSTNSYSCWSKRATRGCYSHEWDEDASRGSPSAGASSPRPGPMRRSRSWMSETEARAKPPRTRPRTERRQIPLEALQEMLLRKRRPWSGAWLNSIDCSTVVKEASTPLAGKILWLTIRPMTQTKSPYKHWTPWRRNMWTSRSPWPMSHTSKRPEIHCM